MSMVGTLSPPTNARYSPDDTPRSSAPSAPETSPSMGNFIDAQQPAPQPRPDTDPVTSGMTSFLATV
jgi:hypothetical protein